MPKNLKSGTAGILRTRTGAHALVVRIADTMLRRFLGLMLARSLNRGEGLLITRCTSVHTLLMQDSIDLVYLDRMGLVVRCVPWLKPWRCSIAGTRSAAHALELSPGSIQRLDIRRGDRLTEVLWQTTGGRNDG